LENGKTWSASLNGAATPVSVKQYTRLEGVFVLPANVVLKGVTAKLMQGPAVRSVQTLKL
jgi:hypothetical protein